MLFSPFERHAFNPTVAGQFDGWLVKPVRAHSLLTWIWPQVHGEAGFDNKSIHHKNLASELLAPVAVEVSEQKMPLRVLLAEDDDVSALVERKMLESLGANVTLVRDGEEAMRVFEEALMSNIPFDLGVFDIRMPKFDGLHVARFIRLLESGQSASHCRLVALSANVFAEDKIVAEQAGFGAFLTKPIALNRLADVFNAHAQVAHTA